MKLNRKYIKGFTLVEMILSLVLTAAATYWLMFTYVQLKQAIQDWAENDAAEFTTATGSGIAPIDVCIQLAEKRLYKEVEFTSGIKTTTFTLTADTNLSAVPQDFISFRYMIHNKGDWIYQKDEAFIREIWRAGTSHTQTDQPYYWGFTRAGTTYTSGNRQTNFIFAPIDKSDVDP